MNCLTSEQIYLFVENELSPQARLIVEDHLLSCVSCREAIEGRRLFLKAAESLPNLPLPSDFADRVMARIFPARTPLIGWLVALAAGVGATLLSLLVLVIASGQSAAGLLLGLQSSLFASVKNAALFLVRFSAFVSTLLNVGQEIVRSLSKGLSALSGTIDLRIQILATLMTLITIFFLFYGIKKKFFAGERYEK